MIVETKNLSLEETAALFDGESAQRNIQNAVHDVRHDDYVDEKTSDSFNPTNELKAQFVS